MNRKKLALGVLAIGTGFSALAAPLQFTNLTTSLLAGVTNDNLLKANTLEAVAYGGDTNFLAVGQKGVYVCGDFSPLQPGFISSNWAANQIGNTNQNLYAVASSGNQFVATGDSNEVYSAANVFSGLSAGNWTLFHPAFNNTVLASGIAFNGTNFLMAVDAPELAWSGTNLPNGIWNPVTSTGNGYAIGESFRGVTPYGTNGGFAICGVFGDVRIATASANAISSQVIFSGVGQPNFNGIAYDGSNTLVCVGVNPSSQGAIMYSNSTSGGWKNAYTNTTATTPPTPTPLNGVAYTGSSFVAVGTNGQVLVSPNGINWTNQYITTNSLSGVAFANTGYLQGIGELVGSDGTVIICGPPPAPPTILANATNCSASPEPPENNALLDTNLPDASHPNGSVVVDWYDTNGVPLMTATNSYIPMDNPNLVFSNLPAIFNYIAKARDLRTGFTSTGTTNTFQINPRPTAYVGSYNTTNCNVGNPFPITFTNTGIGPWTNYWNDGTVQIVTNIVTGNLESGPVTATRMVYPTNNLPNSAVTTSYSITNVLSGDMCMGNEPTDIMGTVNITINPLPRADLMSLVSSNCDTGTAYSLTYTNTGVGPWIVSWNDGTIQTNTGPGPLVATRMVYPANVAGADTIKTNNYFITGVSNADTCLSPTGNITGLVQVFIYPRPTAFAVTTNTICNGVTNVQLQANLTGIGPWTVRWSDGVVQTTNAPYGSGATVVRGVLPSQVTNSLPNTPITNLFTVVGVTNQDNLYECLGNPPGDITGTGMIIVDPRPMAFVITTNTICNGVTNVQLQAKLTGLGPWTVGWSDGFVQTNNAPIGSGVTAVRGVPAAEVTNSFPNTAITNTFTVVGVTNGDNCLGNLPGDITGTGAIIINPRPTASLLSFNSIDCNDGPVYTLTNTLTGIGPWTILWNDGTIQTSNGTPPFVVTRTVYPTNSIGANAVSNNVYYVTNVSNSDSCLGNLPGDINGFVTNSVNPRPTSTAGGTNVICNGTSATVTNILTGLGPWTVYWTNGFAGYTQTVSAATAGPYTNPFAIASTGFNLTNTFTTNATNYYYWVTEVTDSNCMSTAADLAGTNVVRVNPIGTVLTNGFIVASNDFADAGIIYPGIKGFPLTFTVQTTNSPYYITMDKWGTSGSNYLYTTTHLKYAGLLPWTVTLMQVGSDYQGLNTVTNYYAYTFTTFNTNVVITNVVSKGTPGTTFTISISTLNSNSCAEVLATNTVTFVVNAWPSVQLGLAGQTVPADINLATACSGEPVTNEVDLIGGNPPWSITWNDGSNQVNTTSSTIYRIVMTNNIDTGAPVTNLYWVTNLTAKTLTGANTNRSISTNEIGLTEVIIDPVLDFAPTNNGPFYSCYDVAAPLSVGVPPGFTADWYAVSNSLPGPEVATGTNIYVPPVPINLGGNTSVTNIYFVVARYIDTNLTTCYSPGTNVSLISSLCTNVISSIVPQSGTNAVVSWSGNYILQSATNLVPPVSWMNVTTGGLTANSWTNSMLPPPTNTFFRLYAPTN